MDEAHGRAGADEPSRVETAPQSVGVVNAAVKARSHLGVRHIDMPLTSGKLFALLRDSEATPT